MPAARWVFDSLAHQCAPRGPAALAVGGIGAGEQCVVVGLSVSFRNMRGMSEGRFRRTAGAVSLLWLHLVWCPKYRRRILGGRVAAGCGVEHRWDAVMAW
jgi:hypothetical protein